MRRVTFSPDRLPAGQEGFWEKWQSEAAAETDAQMDLYRQGEPLGPDKQSIWRRLKEWYLDHVFAKKCAYCEGTYLAGFPQHAEHWRPKKEVTEFAGDREVVVTRSGDPHPGYWWLAYSWENLVPSCFYCNTGDGKGNKFPIDGSYAFAPEEGADKKELDRTEKPWLLHPFADPNPEDHIGFYKDGTAYAKDKSEYGRWTITVMDLNRENLVIERRTRQEEAIDALGTAAQDAIRHDTDPNQDMDGWDGPEARFSRAVEDRLLPIRNRVGPQIFARPDRAGG